MSKEKKMDTVSVCVIGAGIVGSAAAYALTNFTKSVVLVEQFPLPHSRGSSHGQSRAVRHTYGQQIYANFMPESYRMWERIERIVGEKLIIPTGLITIDSLSSEGITEIKEIMGDVGVVPELLTSADMRAKYPMLKYSKETFALFEKEGAIARADKCIKALQKLFKENGGKIYDGQKVLQLLPGEPVKIVTNGLELYANKVILAAGPWTRDLVKPLKIDLPLKTVATTVCYWTIKDKRYQHDMGFPSFADISFVGTKKCSIYGFPSYEYPGMMKICNHHGQPASPDARDQVDSKEDIRILSKYIQEHFEGVETEPSIVEKCLYTLTPDDDFILDVHPHYPNIVIGAGFSGHGFKMAPLVGKLLAELALQKKPSYDLSPFQIARFNVGLSNL